MPMGSAPFPIPPYGMGDINLLSAAMVTGALRVKSVWYIVYRGPDNLYVQLGI